MFRAIKDATSEYRFVINRYNKSRGKIKSTINILIDIV